MRRCVKSIQDTREKSEEEAKKKEILEFKVKLAWAYFKLHRSIHTDMQRILETRYHQVQQPRQFPVFQMRGLLKKLPCMQDLEAMRKMQD